MTIYEMPKTQERPEDGHRQDGQDGMVPLAQRVERHHTAPVEDKDLLLVDFFPTEILRGLGISAAAGALVGLLVGVLLFQGIIVVPGWEQLFSMWPFTFHFFWVMMGLAAGVLLGGVGTILAASADHIPVKEDEDAH